MRKSPNKLWALGPPLSILLLFSAYYVKVTAFRNAVDARAPWVKDYLGRFVSEPSVVDVPAPSKPVIGKSQGDQPIPAQTPPIPPRPPTLEEFAANHSLWPKAVKLRKPREFPAVVNGKKVGMVQVPAGAETHIVQVNGQQLGLEYQGGGAWVPLADTDLLDRVKISKP